MIGKKVDAEAVSEAVGGKKLFTVVIIREVVVLARDEEDAIEESWICSGQIHDSESSESPSEPGVVRVASPMKKLPSGWDDDCIPFSSEDVLIPLKSLVEAGLAPEFGSPRGCSVCRYDGDDPAKRCAFCAQLGDDL